jgi:hypothetical protein
VVAFFLCSRQDKCAASRLVSCVLGRASVVVMTAIRWVRVLWLL